jgi:endonuclease YncB( thermonuclease family)
MAVGYLEITGKIAVSQFWPSGESDGDTIRVTLDPPSKAFRFRPSQGAPAIPTKALYNAGFFEKDKKGVKKFKPVVQKGQIRIRLQGVDTPELHYLPRVKGAKNFRQYVGETATVELHRQLKKAGAQTVPCRVVTAVDKPNDAVDIYGRVVAEVLVPVDGNKELHINQWLVESGWGFPAFYNTMSNPEINLLASAGSQAEKHHRGVWNRLYAEDKLTPFKWDLQYRKGGPPQPARDKGPLIMPKLFRRQCAYEVKVRTGKFTGKFADYLKSLRPPDKCHATKDFLKLNGMAPRKRLSDFVTPTNRFLATPAGLVFIEKAATIVDSKNRPIRDW